MHNLKIDSKAREIHVESPHPSNNRNAILELGIFAASLLLASYWFKITSGFSFVASYLHMHKQLKVQQL